MVKQHRRQGLILLVVLGMLSLISLLAVTFIVFSGQSRTASMQLARRDYRGTPPDRIFDTVIRQIVRGTNDRESVLWKQSLLEDLVGTTDSVTVTARVSRWEDPTIMRNVTLPTPTLPIPAGQLHGPQLFSKPHNPTNGEFGPFLKIPLEFNANLPAEHDAWVGRTVTFSGGPLAGESFRIIRYIGRVDDVDLAVYHPIQYCIVIDLSTVDHTKQTTTTTGRSWNLQSWLTDDTSHTGASLLYSSYLGTLTSPYSMTVLGGAQNNDGIGIARSGSSVSATTGDQSMVRPNVNYPNQLQAPFNNVAEALQPNLSRVSISATASGSTYNPSGDMDEPYDAADYNNFFLALRRYTDVLTSDEIIPSFHRPELINFIAGLDGNNMDLTILQSNPAVFLSFLELVERATGRPLSYRITNFPSLGPGNPFTLQKNSFFNGGTNLDFTDGARNPQLQFNWAQIGNRPEPQEAFDAWLRWQMRGPWDVDNDGDGIKDSVWVDLNLPLSTSPDGKLLKILAAIYIEDMDGKLDINAAGCQFQADPAYPTKLKSAAIGGTPYAYNPSYPQDGEWPQGLGYGPADIYLRHLFTADQHLKNLMQLKYEALPGTDKTNDELSQIVARRNHKTTHSVRPSQPSNGKLPGLPMSTHGRLGVALDLLGNPILTSDSTAVSLDEELDDPYEFRPLSGHNGDKAISIAEWERITRYNDADRASLPKALEWGADTSWSSISNSDFLKRIRAISPRNVSLTTPRFTRTYQVGTNARQVSSFVEFVVSHCQRMTNSTNYPLVSNAALRTLFPLEFAQNRPLDLNRPFGNGLDDNNNGEVDEPLEFVQPPAQQESFPNAGNVPGDYLLSNANAATFDPVGATRGNYFNYFTGSQSRQLFARHLYCLAQLILPGDYKFPHLPEDATVTPEMRARILAQWAVNVVDYRDADAAMTRFVYDDDPFYQVTGSGRVFSPSWNPLPQNVVFGMEQPELLITESLATHDTRYMKRPGQNEWRQVRVPEGSLFLEFYCPRSMSAKRTAPIVQTDDALAGMPPSLYSVSTNNNRTSLNLSAWSVDNNGNRFPVWRVALLKPDIVNDAPDTDNLTEAFSEKYQPSASPTTQTRGDRRAYYTYQIGNNPSGLQWRTETAGTDPGHTDKLDEPLIDRVLWFTSSAQVPVNATNAGMTLPGLSDPEKRIYYRQEGDGPDTRVEGGQYLVVGPRPITYFGSREQSLPRTPPTAKNLPSLHRIAIRHGTAGSYSFDWVQMWNQDGNADFWLPHRVPAYGIGPIAPHANKMQQCVTMIAGADLPVEWKPPANTNRVKDYIGLNISEPNSYNYYEVPTTQSIPGDTAGDPSIGADGFDNLPWDGYADLSNSTPGSKLVYDAGNDPNHVYFLEEHHWKTSTSSTPANNKVPVSKTQPNWSAAVLQRLADPLLPFDEVLNPYITVDWHSIDLTVFSGEETPDQGAGQIEPTEMYFATRQKSGAHSRFGKASANAATSTYRVGNVGETFFSYETEFPKVVSQPVAASNSYFKFEILSEYYANQSGLPLDRGANASFSTLGYLNQNYVLRGYPNIAEYTHAYFAGAPSRVPDAPFWPNRNFVTTLDLANVPLSGPGTFSQDFFFETPAPNFPRHRFTLDLDQVSTSATAISSAPELLELVETPSPWMDSWTAVNPNETRATGASQLVDELNRTYRAPFNLIPTYRMPGKVNLNTATEPNVIQGLMGNIMPTSNRMTFNVSNIPFRQELLDSLKSPNNSFSQRSVLDGRSGTLQAAGSPYADKQYPTQFPGRFTSMQGRDAFPTGLGLTALYSSPLRQYNNQRMFRPQSVTALMPGGQLINNVHTYNYPAARMTNLVTDRSNVFAVRVTLGYFEYDLDTGLGAEYGAEQGKTSRNSAFYMVDRSIPVGFAPGVDGNSMNCVLSRSIIQ